MKELPVLFENNRTWADNVSLADPEFFANLAKKQSPEFLWIGCADSRVPANQIVGPLPGEVFCTSKHRQLSRAHRF